MQSLKKVISLLLFIVAFAPFFALPARAQEVLVDTITSAKAEVLEIVSHEEKMIAGFELPQTIQTIRAHIKTGTEAGKYVIIENDYLNLAPGDVFYFTKTIRGEDGQVVYFVSEPDRMPVLYVLFATVPRCSILGWGKTGGAGACDTDW
jgi:hypothetical protein